MNRQELTNIERLLTDVKTTVEGKQQAINIRLDELEKYGGKDGSIERWVGEIAEQVSKGHGTSIDSPKPDQRLAEAAGKWFAGSVKGNVALKEEGLQAFGVAKALSEDLGAEGGYLVPQPLQAEILRLGSQVAAVRPISRVLPMTSKSLDIPDLGTEPSVSITAEGSVIPESSPVFGQKTMTARKINALARWSLELEQDSMVALGVLMLTLYAEKIAQKEDEQALEGDGVGSNFTGLFTATGVAEESLGAALTDLDVFSNAWAKLSFPAQAGDLTWVMPPAVWRDVLQLKDTQNRPLVTVNPTATVPRALLGIPVRLTDQILTNRGAGSNEATAYLGAFRRGMIFGDRMLTTLGINPFTSWSTAETDVRVIERVGILVGVPSAFCKITAIQV